MSRAFVINGDEWSYCRERHQRCAGASSDGTCMREECTEIPEWERPKRKLSSEKKEEGQK